MSDELVIPGVGVLESCEPDNIYRVRMPSGEIQAFPAKAEATPENAVDDIVTNPPAPAPLPQADIYAQQLVAGYTDAETGLMLKTTPYAQGQFTALVTLLHLAQSISSAPATVSIWDAANVEHSLPLADVLALLLRYGAYCQYLFNEYAP